MISVEIEEVGFFKKKYYVVIKEITKCHAGGSNPPGMDIEFTKVCDSNFTISQFIGVNEEYFDGMAMDCKGKLNYKKATYKRDISYRYLFRKIENARQFREKIESFVLLKSLSE